MDIPLYFLWELKFARNPLIEWNTIKDGGVCSALVISLFFEFAYYIQDTYIIVFSMVILNQSKAAATRISLLFLFVIAKVRRTKAFIIFGVSM